MQRIRICLPPHLSYVYYVYYFSCYASSCYYSSSSYYYYYSSYYFLACALRNRIRLHKRRAEVPPAVLWGSCAARHLRPKGFSRCPGLAGFRRGTTRSLKPTTTGEPLWRFEDLWVEAAGLSCGDPCHGRGPFPPVALRSGHILHTCACVQFQALFPLRRHCAFKPAFRIFRDPRGAEFALAASHFASAFLAMALTDRGVVGEPAAERDQKAERGGHEKGSRSPTPSGGCHRPQLAHRRTLLQHWPHPLRKERQAEGPGELIATCHRARM